jgi:hypothetical protein
VSGEARRHQLLRVPRSCLCGAGLTQGIREYFPLSTLLIGVVACGIATKQRRARPMPHRLWSVRCRDMAEKDKCSPGSQNRHEGYEIGPLGGPNSARSAEFRGRTSLSR